MRIVGFGRKAAIFAIICVFILCSIVFADTIQIPFSCYPKDIQAKFEKVNKKVDLSANDRTEDSWAFINSKGTSYDIVTYAPVTLEELELIKKTIMPEAK